MSYVFRRIPAITLDIDVPVPELPADAKLPTLNVKYRLLSVTERREMIATTDGMSYDEMVEYDQALMAKNVLDFPKGIKWEDVDDSGEPVGKPYQREFSQDLLAELLDISYMRQALTQGFLRAQADAPQARQKN